MYILNAAQMRDEEARGFRDGISYKQMMTTAGIAVADLLAEHMEDRSCVTVVCGKGKNGGDGFVAAKRFQQLGKKAYIVLAMGGPADALALQMYRAAVARGVMVYDYTTAPEACAEVMRKSDLLVDAVFGIGFSGELRESLRALASLYNDCAAVKAAVDLPSGLCADAGTLPALYFHADYTVTMHTLKPVHVFSPAAEHCGRVLIADIGFSPESDDPAMVLTDLAYVKSCFAPRALTSHKGTYGFALSVCGSRNMPGAAALAARAAVESGAGLVGAAFPDSAYVPLTTHLTEPVFISCPSAADGTFAAAATEILSAQLARSSAALFGCGVGQSEGAAAVLTHLLQTCDRPLILDADGINLLSLNKDILKDHNAPVLLTPHPGEMARLTGMSVAAVNADRVRVASDFAREYGVVVLLKGRQTVVASPDGACFINPTGNPGMAVGGSGDMLSGILVSFAAQGLSLTQAAVCGAYVHGAAGDEAARRYSMMGTTPSRMLEMLPMVLSQIEKEM